MPPKTIVLLSGGMNSAVMLYEMLTFENVEVVECMVFDHYQENAEEVDFARAMCDKLGVESSLWSFEPAPLMDKSVLAMADGKPPMLTTDEVNPIHLCSHMLNHAVYRARHCGAEMIAAGYIEEEAPFTWESVDGFTTNAVLLADGFDPRAIEVTMPLFEKTKPEVFKLAQDLNRVGEILMGTTSCLKGNTELRHPWGWGCGSCDGCVRRWRAWEIHQHGKKS